MRRRLTRALVALALGWPVAAALAAEPGTDSAAVAPAGASATFSPLPNVAAPVLARGQADDETGYGHFLGGAGVYILKPFIERDRAWVKSFGVPILNKPGKGTSDFIHQQVTDFSYDYEVAPRGWLGWVSDSGLGARARYFHFDITGHAPPATLTGVEDSHDVAISPAEPVANDALNDNIVNENGTSTDVLTVFSQVQMDVWDLEVIDQFRTGCWLVTVAGGVRHADFAEFYDAVRRNSADTAGTDVRTLHSSNRFTGTGPTVALDGRYLIGGTGLALYGTVRGGYLFGDRRQLAFAVSTSNTGPDVLPPGDRGSAFFKKADSVPVTEGELGVEWSKDMGSFRPFVQAGLVGQAWFNALANDDHLTEPPSSSETSNGMFGLFGVSITAGVNF